MKFSIGDRVRVYSGMNVEVGEVQQLAGPVIGVSKGDSPFLSWYSVKQCRRLKPKKERRRIWAHESYVNNGTFHKIPPDGKPGEWIEFVEVRKAKS